MIKFQTQHMTSTGGPLMDRLLQSIPNWQKSNEFDIFWAAPSFPDRERINFLLNREAWVYRYPCMGPLCHKDVFGDLMKLS